MGRFVFFEGGHSCEPSRPAALLLHVLWVAWCLSLPIAASGQSAASIHGRVINGSSAVRGEFPWMVSVGVEGSSDNCGGALIGPRDVLTAAHCVINDSGAPVSFVTVRHGILNLTDRGVVVRSARILVHPSYLTDTNGFDVAVVRLATSLPGPFLAVGTASDDAEVLRPGGNGSVLGWGLVVTSDDGLGYRANTLQEARVPYIPTEVCQRGLMGEGDIDPRTMFCAGVPTGTINRVDTCLGDSGGPFLANSRDGPVAVGVVSWGRASCDGYGVYTRLAPVRSWLQSNMWFQVAEGVSVKVRGTLAVGQAARCGVTVNPGVHFGKDRLYAWRTFTRSGQVSPWTKLRTADSLVISREMQGRHLQCLVFAEDGNGLRMAASRAAAAVRAKRRRGRGPRRPARQPVAIPPPLIGVPWQMR